MAASKLAFTIPSGSSGTITAGMLYTCRDDELARVVVTLPSAEAPAGSTVLDDRWIWPESYVPGNASRRTIGFPQLAEFPLLAMSVKKYILAQMFFPIEHYSDLPGLAKRSNYLSRIAKEIGLTRGDCKFGEVGLDVLRSAVGTVLRDAPSLKKTVIRYLCEIKQLNKRKVLSDAFTFDWSQLAQLTEAVDSELSERPETHQEDSYGVYQPLPDAYVAEAGKIWMYYLIHVMPNLERIFRLWPAISASSQGPRLRPRAGYEPEILPASLRIRELSKLGDALGHMIWVDANGLLIDRLPFVAPDAFPPRTTADLFALWGTVQGCLVLVLLLLTAARASEIESLLRDCTEAISDTASEPSTGDPIPWLVGRTKKSSALKRGTERDWPIPRELLQPILFQQTIGRYLAPEGKSLWVSVNRAYWLQGKMNCYYHTTVFAARYGLDHLLQGSPAHPHRFRKTIVRLAALSLTGAPYILQDILGHADITGTVSYIMSDPNIRDELAQIAVDMELEQSTTVAENLDAAGGKGGKQLRAVRDEFFDKLKVPANERQQRRRLHEFVDAKLTEGASDLKMIFPGVICVKPKAAVGACGYKDEILPSSCQCSCSYYVAMPGQRTATRANIAFLMGELESPRIQKNVLLAPWYRAQLAEQIGIFEDIAAEFRGDARCQSVLAART